MPNLTDTAVRLYRRFFSTPGGVTAETLPELTLDGNQAIAMAELTIAESAALGYSFPADAAETAWRSELQRHRLNNYGKPVSALTSESSRGVIASAMGQSLSGQRTSVFLTGPEIAAAQDMLISAAGKLLPLVVHLTSHAMPAQGVVRGSGHQAIHLCADSGWFILVASNVQQAVDYSYIARRVAEQTLVPGLVVMDDEQTAQSVQQVQLLSRQQIDRFIGPAAEMIASPTAAQEMLFGEQRRRVPKWHDLDRPVLQGALHDGASYACGSLAKQAYFAEAVDKALDEAFAAFHRISGRQYAKLTFRGHKNPQLVMLAQGSAVETAILVAEHLNKSHNQRVAVLGINAWRPLADDQIVSHLKGVQTLAVLERIDPGLARELPLMRELRSCFDRVLGSGRRNSDDGSQPTQLPELRSVCYGVGGLALSSRDLAALPEYLAKSNQSQVVLGAAFFDKDNPYPKRQVMLDKLKRAYPEQMNAGLVAETGVEQPVNRRSISISIHRRVNACASLVHQAAEHLHQLLDGGVRSRVGSSWETHAARTADLLVAGEDEVLDPGDVCAVDLAIIADAQLPDPELQHRIVPELNVADGGLLLVQGGLSADALQAALSEDWQTLILDKKLSVYTGPDLSDLKDDQLQQQSLLGSLAAVLVSEGRIVEEPRKLYSQHEKLLDHLSSSERDRYIAAYRRGFENTRRQALSPLAGRAQSTAKELAVPVAVRSLTRNDDEYDSLPRFWDQVGITYQQGTQRKLTVDPYLSTGTVAPLTSTFRNFSSALDKLPLFDAAACTGCGACWIVCPESAIGSLAIGSQSLVDSAMRLGGAGALRQISNQLVARLAAQGRSGEIESFTASGMIEQAYRWLGEKMSLAEDRKQAIDGAVADIAARLGDFPLAVTDPLFHQAEQARKDSGEYLAVVINPDTCKSCGLCEQQCRDDAIKLVGQTAENVERSRRDWQLWGEFPDTTPATIERLMADSELGPMAASMLSRYCLLSMAGGDGAEAGSGEKIALHMALAATEFRQQPVTTDFVKQVQTTYVEINDLIKQKLSAVLPVDDLAQLDDKLGNIQEAQLDLGVLAEKFEHERVEHSVDTADVQRLIQISRELADLSWRYTSGINSLGRARFGLAVAPGSVSTWAGSFPNNPFQVPVQIDSSGDTAQLAAGLMEGHLRETCEAVAILRKARLEIDQPAGASFQRAELSRLTWRDLGAEERRLCPPLLLVGGDDVLAGQGLSQVLWLLNSGLPIKIVVLADLDFGLTTDQVMSTQLASQSELKSNLTFLAMAQTGAYVAQSSIAFPQHLGRALAGVLDYDGPALINIHAPSPLRHGFAADQAIAQAELAVNSRVFPLCIYDPSGEGVFGMRLSLEGNPSVDEAWLAVDERIITPVTWALGQKRFANMISPLDDDDDAPADLFDWLALDQRGRSSKVPVVQPEGQSEPLKVSPELARVADRVAHQWRTLQELAGLVTPFTARVEQSIREQLAAEHEKEIAALKSAHETKLAEMKAQLSRDISGKVRDQLLNLVAAQRPNGARREPAEQE